MTQKNVTEERREFREKNISRQFQQLNNSDQQAIYNLVWSLTAKDLLYRIEKDKSKEDK